MLINASTAVDGDKCTLVPYLHHHVATYHEWMKDPYVLEMTASEPLSVEEEYAMQESWREDGDKLTFIVLDRTRGGAMAGDVNLFFTIGEDEVDGGAGGEECERMGEGEAATAASGDSGAARPVAEIEVMIAESASRRRGLAREALRLMMAYARRELGTTRFVAKVLDSNDPSLRLFEGIGFALLRREPDFGETHLLLDCRNPAAEAGRRLAGDVDSLRVRRPTEAEWGPDRPEGEAGGADEA